MDYTAVVSHMSPEDAHLHQEIMETKELLLDVDRNTLRSIRMPLRTRLQDLRSRQYERFGEQYEDGVTISEIARYWNRTPQFVRHELSQIGKK